MDGHDKGRFELSKIAFRSMNHNGMSVRIGDLWKSHYKNSISLTVSDELWKNRDEHEIYCADDESWLRTEDRIVYAKVPFDRWDYIDRNVQNIRSHCCRSTSIGNMLEGRVGSR